MSIANRSGNASFSSELSEKPANNFGNSPRFFNTVSKTALALNKNQLITFKNKTT